MLVVFFFSALGLLIPVYSVCSKRRKKLVEISSSLLWKKCQKRPVFFLLFILIVSSYRLLCSKIWKTKQNLNFFIRQFFFSCLPLSSLLSSPLPPTAILPAPPSSPVDATTEVWSNRWLLLWVPKKKILMRFYLLSYINFICTVPVNDHLFSSAKFKLVFEEKKQQEKKGKKENEKARRKRWRRNKTAAFLHKLLK